MDLASLTVFRAVAREQSVTRAAARLGRAASNITTRIQHLEDDLGVRLFQRDHKRMALTGPGQSFLHYAERILSLADEARQMLHPDAPMGRLRIGAMECAAASRLPAPLARFTAAWPQVVLELSTGPSRSLQDAVLDYGLDCALIAIARGQGAPDGLDQTPVFGEDLILLLPPGHPPVEHPAEILPKALAAFAPGCTYRACLEDWLARDASGIGRFTIQEVGSYHAMYASTAAGACFCVMPRSVLRLMAASAPVVEHPLLRIDTSLICRSGFATPAFCAFRDMLMPLSNLDPAET